jgi:hypothetical protein
MTLKLKIEMVLKVAKGEGYLGLMNDILAPLLLLIRLISPLSAKYTELLG